MEREPSKSNRFVPAREELERVLAAARQLVARERQGQAINPTLDRIAGDLERLAEKAAAQSFQVAVVALLKSGKSTLINALLGAEFLPTTNAPETAAVVRLRHAGDDPEGSLRDAGSVVARGRERIQSHLRQLNARWREAGPPAPRAELLLEAPLVALAGRALGRQRFEVLDTPGPDEAGSDGLRAEVDRLLREADVILYVLDYSRLRSSEEHGLFDRLAAVRPELLRRLSERLFFAVNKIDLQNSKALSPAETRQYVARILAEQLPGLEIEPGRILLLSAEQALLARQVQAGDPAPGVLRDFARTMFGLRAPEELRLPDCRPLAAALLQESRILEVEQQVVSFVYEHRGRIFLQSALDDLQRDLLRLANHLDTVAGGLRLDHQSLTEHGRRLEEDLRQTEEAFREVDQVASGSAEMIAAWVQARFDAFRGQVEADLNEACAALLPGGSGAQEGTCDPLALEERLAGAHRGIALRLRQRFGAFWAQLEQEAWLRQRQMVEELEQRLRPLAARVEEAVSRRLEVSLGPVLLQLPRPSPEDLHAQIASGIDRFVERRPRAQTTQQSQQVLVRPRGWCSKDHYVTQTLEVTRQVTELTLRRDEVLACWREWIRASTDASLETARAIIRDQVGAAAEEARHQLGEYRDGYLRAVRHTLQESQQGEILRRRRLLEVEAACGQVAALRRDVARCLEFLEPEAPGAGGR